MTTQTRGERNNNPTNLIRNGIEWLGMDGVPQKDARFCTFDNAIHGMRAAFITMHHKITTVPGLTIGGLIGIWAPPVENNTNAYIDAVCFIVKCPASLRVEWSNTHMLTMIMLGIIHQENGRCVYDLGDITDAYSAALAHCRSVQNCLPL